MSKISQIYHTVVDKIKQLFKNNFQKIPFWKKMKQEKEEDCAERVPFNSLSPVGNADEGGHYSKMLLWALQNRKEKDIKNIAVTGPYGSGKSSILKTFEANNTDKSLVFLKISLATFKDEADFKDQDSKEIDSDLNTVADKQAQLRLIELSILQQIFYHEKDETIPDSRFKKTRSFTDKKVKGSAVILFFLILSLLYQLDSDWLWVKLYLQNAYDWLKITVHAITLAALAAGTFWLIKMVIRPLRSIQLKKFNLQDVEFAIDENITKSILNEHLDQILYFFEVTPYTVVIFEDLDRFNQTEIFTKLRELNHLINYSNKINREVAFIYAVRDDMFQNAERTKFFDFIVPVIPVIHASNSNTKLLKIVKENKYGINADLLENISFLVDDMRLLYNIMNEFYLYSKKLNEDQKLDPNKLMALVVYKNIYPYDFVSLSRSEGVLFDVFDKKDIQIRKMEENISSEIIKLRSEISTIESESTDNVKDLRSIYIAKLIGTLGEFHSLSLNSRNIAVNDLIADENFVLIQSDQLNYTPIYIHPHNSSYYR
jgi:hypothetical protein